MWSDCQHNTLSKITAVKGCTTEMTEPTYHRATHSHNRDLERNKPADVFYINPHIPTRACECCMGMCKSSKKSAFTQQHEKKLDFRSQTLFIMSIHQFDICLMRTWFIKLCGNGIKNVQYEIIRFPEIVWKLFDHLFWLWPKAESFYNFCRGKCVVAGP